MPWNPSGCDVGSLSDRQGGRTFVRDGQYAGLTIAQPAENGGNGDGLYLRVVGTLLEVYWSDPVQASSMAFTILLWGSFPTLYYGESTNGPALSSHSLNIAHLVPAVDPSLGPNEQTMNTTISGSSRIPAGKLFDVPLFLPASESYPVRITQSDVPFSPSQVMVSETAPPPTDCDLNNDLSIDVLDLQMMVNQIIGTDTCGQCDLNGDGSKDVLDLQTLVNVILGASPCPN